MSIKLICSDIDGTLLQYGKKELEDEIFEQIREPVSYTHLDVYKRQGMWFGCAQRADGVTQTGKDYADMEGLCYKMCIRDSTSTDSTVPSAARLISSTVP